MTQKERIIAYCKKHGSIDRLSAYEQCGIFELSSRICELEKRGYVFEHKPEDVINRYGEVIGHTRYILIKEGNHGQKSIL